MSLTHLRPLASSHQPLNTGARDVYRRDLTGRALSADEIDAIGTKRYESTSGGEREIQRTMLELLNQLDGFDSMGDVKVRCRV